MGIRLFILAIFAMAATAQNRTAVFEPLTGKTMLLPNGLGAAGYSASFAAATGVSVTAVTHGQGVKPVGFCYDNATPANLIAQTANFPTVAANGDMVFAWTGSKTGYCVISALGNQVGATGSTGATGAAGAAGQGVPTGGTAGQGLTKINGTDYNTQWTTPVTCTGDLSGSAPGCTVSKVNGVALSGLATGIVKNTTTTGVPSIAVAGDFPTLNQSTTGNATTATALASTPSLCSTGQAPTGVLANGNATGCASIGAGGTSSVLTTVTFSATPTFTVSTSTIQVFTITLTNNVTSSTLTTTSATNGQEITFNICQDGTGSRTFVFPSNVTGAGTIIGTASTCSRQTFRYDGTNAIALTSMVCPACSSSVVFPGSSSGSTALQASAVAGSTTITLPALTGTATVSPFITNAQAATYQVLAADFTQCKTITVASGTFTVTLVASGSQPATGQCINILNYGSGVVTVARSGQNINGGTSSLTIPAASATAPTGSFVVSDGTNYFAELFGAASGGGSPGTPTGSIQKNIASAFAGQANIFGGGSVLTSYQSGNEFANVTLTQGSTLTLPAQTTPYSVILATSVVCDTFFTGSVLRITTAFSGGTGGLTAKLQHGSVDIGAPFDVTQTAGTFISDVPGMGCVGTATNDVKITFTGDASHNLSGYTAGAIKIKVIGSASE